MTAGELSAVTLTPKVRPIECLSHAQPSTHTPPHSNFRFNTNTAVIAHRNVISLLVDRLLLRTSLGIRGWSLKVRRRLQHNRRRIKRNSPLYTLLKTAGIALILTVPRRRKDADDEFLARHHQQRGASKH